MSTSAALETATLGAGDFDTAALNAGAAAALIAGLVASGVREVVFSPGSRSTPLVLAAHAHPALRLTAALDERAGGFLALGLARATGGPVTLLCTSGSAGAHYLPAVVEADRGRVPLVVLTADRPPELLDCGANQAVAQHGFFAGNVRHARDLGPPAQGTEGAFFDAGRRAAERALAGPPGPVHLNVPFREPLWAAGVEVPATGRAAGLRVDATAVLPAGATAALADRLAAAHRGVIHCGADADDRGAALTLAERLGWPLLAEATSGGRFGGGQAGPRIAHADGLLTGVVAPPDLVVRAGRPPLSRRVGAWLSQAVDHTLLFDEHAERADPHHAADTLVVAAPAQALAALAERVPRRRDRGWLEAWRHADDAAEAVLAEACRGAFDEVAVARAVVADAPLTHALHLGNSTPVRDVDAFAPVGGATRRVFASRGASGIDGAIAQCAGEAIGGRAPVVALLGDLTFLHDLGGLLLAGQLRADVTAVVIDNGGGGIFGQLPVAAHPSAFEACFLTPQRARFSDLCTGCGVAFRSVEGRGALRAALAEPTTGPRVILVVVDRGASQAQRRALTRSAGAVIS